MTLSRVSANRDAGASILVVEDDEQIAELMRDFLEAEGFQVRHAGSGRETTDQLALGRPDLVLLDVMLPDESGFEICRRLRRDSDVPVLFLSARDSDADKIRGLGLGGDDYIVKSATPAEVVARVKAVLRRASPAGGLRTFRFGELEVDLAAHEVSCEGRRIELTAREFDLLRVLVEHPRQVFSRDQLFELVLGLVRRPQRGRGVRRPPAPEDRAGPGQAPLHRHRLGRGLPARSGQQMRRRPIRIRTFILGTVLVLLLLPSLTGGAAWLIERNHQQENIQRRLTTARAYLTSHGTGMQDPASAQGFAKLLARLDLLAQVVIAGPSEKGLVYVSPALDQAQGAKSSRGRTGTTAPAETNLRSWADDQRLIPVGTPKSQAVLVTDLYYRPASRTTRALVALLSGVVVLLAGLAVAVWLAGRWMVAPLARLSAQVDKVAGGDLTIAVPRSQIGEIANIAQAVEGMTDALGETEQRRAEADEARRFLVTSIAHDLRTPLFALRGHLQAVRSRLGDPAVHLERAEARADALERLVGNLFAYTRDDYAQPAPQLESVPVAELLREVAAGLEHTTRLRDNTFELAGDRTVGVIADRDRLKRALTNILDNAIRYSPPGAPIHIGWAAPDESTVEISVEDQGPGIDPRVLPHIFEPGIRGIPAADSPDSGAGLGLTIAKRLLEHQDATLAAHNRPTRGALIRLTLRRTPSADPS